MTNSGSSRPAPLCQKRDVRPAPIWRVVAIALQSPRRFWLQKAGNRPDEYEDAFDIRYPQRIDASSRGIVRLTVSDGASESAFARKWANILTDAFVALHPNLCGLNEKTLNVWLALAQERWHAKVPWDRIPWHGEAKARAGAFATLLGLTVRAALGSSQRLSWQAMAVGDSCLFIVRDDRLWLSFPIEGAADFDNNPDLVCSNPSNACGLWESVRLNSGECAAGDLFVLASDALASWFLAQSTNGKKPWGTLMALDLSRWEAWVEEARRSGSMRNDDTTLVTIKVA